MKTLLMNVFLFLVSLNFSFNSFQSSFFKEMNKKFIKKNLIISPLSAYQILSLTSNGAMGNTLQEMLLTLSSNNIKDLNKNNLNILNTVKKFSTLEVANAIMTVFNPKKEFKNIANTYDATIETLQNVNQVNNWCKRKTHGKISKILNNIPPKTVMILLNAIYFKGLWKNQFDPQNTRKSNFYNHGKINNAVEVDMMKIKEDFNYYEDETVQIIEIPFKKDSSSALIFLPRKIDINRFLSDLDDKKISKYIKQMFSTKVDLSLPRFEIEFSSELNNALQNLGMKDAFKESKADFSGMRKEKDIYINNVIQKVYLKVDETGAEAAAVTSVFSMEFSMPIQDKQMIVDRPFIMFLRSKLLPQGNDILFAAKIEKLK